MPDHEEVEEHVQHAHNPFDKTVAGIMAIVAALLAIVSVLGQHYNTEQLLKQQESADQWAFYQAKDIRRYVAEGTRDILFQERADAARTAKYEADSSRYRKEQKEIKEKAEELERERNANGEKASRFHFGEVFLEVAIVFLSLTILTKRKPLAVAGLVSAVIGVIWASTGLLG
jgi:Domain of unknown function (DUF4337)